MSKSEQSAPLGPLDTYREVEPLLRHVRVMDRFFREVVNDHVRSVEQVAALHVGFMKILNEEFAPHAITLALAIGNLEDAFPVIREAYDAEDAEED